MTPPVPMLLLSDITNVDVPEIDLNPVVEPVEADGLMAKELIGDTLSGAELDKTALETLTRAVLIVAGDILELGPVMRDTLLLLLVATPVDPPEMVPELETPLEIETPLPDGVVELKTLVL